MSLQYGEVEKDIKFLGADRVINDPAIDQLIDMDGFAAQIAALDAVVAISGTPAHLAGAMGVPTAVLRDDWFRRQWPVMTDRVPWYPNLRVVGKDGREWDAVFDDAWIALHGLMAGGASGSDGSLKTQRYQIVFHMGSFMPAGAGPSSSVFLISEPFEVFPVAPIDEFLIRLAHMNLDWRGFVHPG